MARRFSEHHGFVGAEPPITTREDAPLNLRYAVAQIAVDAGMTPGAIRGVVCSVLLVPPDQNNWSPYPNIWNEVQDLLRECPWFKVYDIAERIYERLRDYPDMADSYRDGLNRFFREGGIGWDMTEEGIRFRGGDAFTAATAHTKEVLEASGRLKASSEIHEAIRDISRRPQPDVTGAIQHAIAALECTARDVTRDSKSTLGGLISKLDLPKPLDAAIEKLWGFASEKARHVREVDQVHAAEAELVVSVACAVCTFLSMRAPNNGTD